MAFSDAAERCCCSASAHSVKLLGRQFPKFRSLGCLDLVATQFAHDATLRVPNISAVGTVALAIERVYEVVHNPVCHDLEKRAQQAPEGAAPKTGSGRSKYAYDQRYEKR